MVTESSAMGPGSIHVEERPGERRNGGRCGSGFRGAIALSFSATDSVPGGTGIPFATGMGRLPGISATRYSGRVTSSVRFKTSKVECARPAGWRFSDSWAPVARS